MIFYRTAAFDDPDRRKPSVRDVRTYTAVALLALPAGMVLRRIESSGPAWSFEAWLGVGIAVASVALIALAAWMAIKVMISPVQHIVAGEVAELDERELQLRQKALGWSYRVLCTMVITGLAYASVGSDFGVPMPDDYEEWNGIFWSAFLVMVLMPAAYLAWTISPASEDDE